MTPKVKNDNFRSSLCSFVWKHRKSEQSLKKSNIICGRTWTFNIEMQFSFTKGTREFLFWQMRDRLSPICTNWTTATLSLADCCAASALKMIDLQYVKNTIYIRERNKCNDTMLHFGSQCGSQITLERWKTGGTTPGWASCFPPSVRITDHHISTLCHHQISVARINIFPIIAPKNSSVDSNQHITSIMCNSTH